jgi:hypothetical protein
MPNDDIQKLNDRVTTLEQQSFGTNPAIHPLTFSNLKYQLGAIGGTASGRSSTPTTTTIPINQSGTPQLLDFSVNNFVNGLTWSSTSHKFTVSIAGVYLVSCTVSYNPIDMEDGVAYSAIIKQNNTVVSQSDVSAGGISNSLGITTIDLINASANDTISFYCQTSSTHAMTINSASGVVAKQ